MESTPKKLKSAASYKPEWEHRFAICEAEFGVVKCVLCGANFSCLKSCNFARHLSHSHSTFDTEFPFNSLQRKREIAACKAKYINILPSNAVRLDHFAATLLTYEISYILAKHKRPYEAGEEHKESIIKAMEIIHGDDEKFSDFAHGLPLSRQTVVRRVTSINNDLVEQLIHDLERCTYFSIQLDESTDVTDTAQLLIFVRMVFDDLSVKEELLSMVSLHSRSTSNNIYNEVLKSLTAKSASLNKLVSVTADGAPNITGKNNGLIALLRANPDFKNIHLFHCLIHQQALCMKNLSIPDVENFVVKIINSIRAHATQHRLFIEFSQKNDSEYRDLKYYTAVRWLSKGLMVERFYLNMVNIYQFFEQKGIIYEKLMDLEFIIRIAFLVDLTKIVNGYNTELQGKNKNFWDMLATIDELKSFLNSAASYLSINRIHGRFSTLQKMVNDTSAGACLPYFPTLLSFLNILIQSFNDRFTDFDTVAKIYNFLIAPFNSPIDTLEIADAIQLFDPELKENLPSLMIDLDHLPTNRELKGVLAAGGNIWPVIAKNNKYPVLLEIYKKLTCCFGSTYLCESTFSNLKLIKSAIRNSLTDNDLQNALRIPLSTYKPNLQKLAAGMQNHLTH